MSANRILLDSHESTNDFDSPKLTKLTRRDLLNIPFALALVGIPLPDTDDPPANPGPNLSATEDEVRYNLRAIIPFLHERLDKATMTVQSHPAICPPKDPYLAHLLAGLTILGRELRDLELALYRYLVGEIDAAEWHEIYAQTRPMARYAALGIIDDVAAINLNIKNEAKAKGGAS